MNSRPKQELSDEVLSELLAADEAATDNAEARAMIAALRSYRVETLAQAERRSATLPSLAAGTKTKRWATVPQWSLTAVALIAVTAGVVHFAGSDGDAPLPDLPKVAATAQTTPESEIAADNQLLSSIDQALRYHGISPAAEFGVESGKQAQHAAHTEVTD